MSAYTHVADLVKSLEPPADGTLSRTIYQDDSVKAVLFGFSAGQELSEHTASTPAILHFLQGEVSVTLGDDAIDAKSGTWIHMPPQMRHSLRARTPAIMLLLLLKQGAN